MSGSKGADVGTIDTEGEDYPLTKKLELIREKLDCNHLLALVYNADNGSFCEEINQNDHRQIEVFLRGLQVKNVTLLIHGIGGIVDEALILAKRFRKKFSSMKVLIPHTCGSALGYIPLVANKACCLKETKWSQFDPYFIHNGVWYRALTYYHDDTNVTLHEKARDAFQKTRDRVLGLLKENPSLFKHDEREFETIDEDNIATAFMNSANDHDHAFRAVQLEGLPFNYQVIDDEELKELCLDFLEEAIKDGVGRGTRFVCGSTNPVSLSWTKNPDLREKFNLMFFY